MNYEFYRSQQVNIFTKLWHLVALWNWCGLQSYCNLHTKKSWMIFFLWFFFHLFFFHKSINIINNELWMLQNSKNQYIHKVMAFSGSLKLMFTKIILQLCYKNSWMISFLSFFHSFFFHISYYIINIEIWTLQTSRSQYIHQVMASNVS